MIDIEIQKPLFRRPFSDSNLIELMKIGLDRDVFGVTKIGLREGVKYGALKTIFIGMHNLEIPPKMLFIQEGEEILKDVFVAGHFKMWHPRPYLNPDIPQDFFELKRYINRYSDKNGFACLENNFKRYFDIEQEIRLAFLKQNDQKRFVKSFLADYKSRYDPNYDGESKGVYVDIIYDELTSLNEKAKELLG